MPIADQTKDKVIFDAGLKAMPAELVFTSPPIIGESSPFHAGYIEKTGGVSNVTPNGTVSLCVVLPA